MDAGRLAPEQGPKQNVGVESADAVGRPPRPGMDRYLGYFPMPSHPAGVVRVPLSPVHSLPAEQDGGGEEEDARTLSQARESGGAADVTTYGPSFRRREGTGFGGVRREPWRTG